MTTSIDTTAVEHEPAARVVSVEWSRLRAALKAALVVASTDESRTVLNSILVEVEQDQIRLVTTDGNRLLRVLVALPVVRENPHRNFSSLIRRDAAIAWTKIATPKGGAIPLKVELTSKGEDFSTSGATISSCFGSSALDTTDAQFPPYEQAIPLYEESRKPAHVVGLSAKHLGDVGTIGGLIASGRTGGVELQLGSHELDPIRIDIHNPIDGFDATYVIMPMRI